MVLTDFGKNAMRNLITGGSTDYLAYMCVGVGSEALSGIQTTLGSEVYRAAATIDNTVSGETTMSLYLSAMTGSGYILNEIGTAHASSGGSIWTKDNCSGLTKTIDMEVYFDKKIRIMEA